MKPFGAHGRLESLQGCIYGVFQLCLNASIPTKGKNMTKYAPQLRVPATYMRGGTSKGVFFNLTDLPEAAQKPGSARDALLYCALLEAPIHTVNKLTVWVVLHQVPAKPLS